eukprot:TRINITY_DN27524_c0_g1_i1.p1 TRINITY_DN27524_c0_g1~~TRINITY_DN27524_c0_g1_i1.p1  ORF type:complete len:355 (-),score=56.17 TRINITY_DN27524_c0_g1_i1:57-1067(-)
MLETIRREEVHSVADISDIFEQLRTAAEHADRSMRFDASNDPAPLYSSSQIQEITSSFASLLDLIDTHCNMFEPASVKGRDIDTLDDQIKQARASLRELSLLAHDIKQPKGLFVKLAHALRLRLFGATDKTQVANDGSSFPTHDFFRAVKDCCPSVDHSMSKALRGACRFLHHLTAKKEPCTIGDGFSASCRAMTDEFMMTAHAGSTRDRLNMLVRAAIDVAHLCAEQEQVVARFEKELELKRTYIQEFQRTLHRGMRLCIKYTLVRLGQAQSADFGRTFFLNFVVFDDVVAVQESLEAFRDAVAEEKALRSTWSVTTTTEQDASEESALNSWDVL